MQIFRYPAGVPLHSGLGACRAWGVEAKFDPGEDSFCRVCSPIAVAMGQKVGEKWTAEAVSQPTIPKSDRLLADIEAQSLDHGR